MTENEFQQGDLIQDRYEIIQKIGRGATAVVYKALDRLMDRTVALKVIPHSEKIAERIKREIKIASQLNHPNIVTIYDFLISEDYFVVVMEYVDGVPLRRVLTRRKKLPWQKAVFIAYQVANALEEAHRKEIIHRDIKPENIMITRDGKVKLADFGIASLISRKRERKASGTLGYMSPEQITGRYVDETTDLFALGSVLYEMLTGENPFYADSLKETAMRVLNHDPPPPSSLEPTVPEKLDAIVMKLLAKDPEFRFQSATHLKEAIKELQKSTITVEDVEAASQVEFQKQQLDPVRIFRMSVFILSFLLLAFFVLPLRTFYSGITGYIISLGLIVVSFVHPLSAIWLAGATTVVPLFTRNIAIASVITAAAVVYLLIFSFGKRVYYSPLPLLALLTRKVRLFPFTVFISVLAFDTLAAFAAGIASSLIYVYTKAAGLLSAFPFFAGVEKSSLNTLGGLLKPLVGNPGVIAEVIIWGVVAAVGAAIRESLRYKRYAPQVALLTSTIAAILAYQLLAVFTKTKYNDSALLFAILIPLIFAVLISFFFSVFETDHKILKREQKTETSY